MCSRIQAQSRGFRGAEILIVSSNESEAGISANGCDDHRDFGAGCYEEDAPDNRNPCASETKTRHCQETLATGSRMAVNAAGRTKRLIGMAHLSVGVDADADAWPGQLGRHRVKWAKKGIRRPNRVFTFFHFYFLFPNSRIQISLNFWFEF